MSYTVYALNYREDFKNVKERWLIHDIYDHDYLGFTTRKAALKYAYKLLKTKYLNDAKRGHLGIIKLVDNEKLLKSIHYKPNTIGWYKQMPVLIVPQGDILRIYSDGTAKCTNEYLSI